MDFEKLTDRARGFLQLCANDNIQVCNITSPANYFHVLRRQMLRRPQPLLQPNRRDVRDSPNPLCCHSATPYRCSTKEG